MDAPTRHDHTPAFGERPADVPSAAFLSRIFDRVDGGMPRQPVVAERLPGEAGLDAHDWQESLELACRRVGARVRSLELCCREACDADRFVAPIVTWTREAGWTAIIEATGDGAVVVAPAAAQGVVSAEALARQLGLPSADATHPWLVVERGLASVSSSPGVKLPPFRRLVELIRPDRSDLLTIVLYALLVGGLTLATPIAVQQLVNTVAFGGLVQPVVVLALLLFGGLAFSGLLSTFQAYLAEMIQRRVFVRACIDFADRLPRVRSDAFRERHGPEVVNRFFDLVTVQKTGATLLLGGTSVVLQTVAGLLILSFYHPLMLGFSVLLVLCIGFVVFVLGRGAERTAIGESSEKYRLAEWMEELARHPGIFRNRAGRGYALARADALAAAWVEARRRHYRVVLRQIVGSFGLQVVASTGVLMLGGFLVVSGQLTLGQLVASEIIVTAVVAAVARLGKQLESFYDLLAAVEKIGVLLDLPLERNRGRAPDTKSGAVEIEMKNVCFEHAGRRVLDDVSLRIEPGERVLIAGPGASGKSTLLDLLCGFATPSAGHVAVDGHDLRSLRLEAFREGVVCLRDPEVFSGSIADNLRVGRSAASTSDLDEALGRVGLLDEVRALPDGLDTRLATDGDPLSRSQVVRLMLARAVLARPRLLVLDEALVHLDATARARAIDVLFDEDAPWTLVIVSHRDDVRARCDRTIDLGGPVPGPGGPTS